MMGSALVLVFNLDQNTLKALQGLCDALAIGLKAVPPEAFMLPLGALFGIPVDSMEPVDVRSFSEPMLVMCNLNEDCFNTFLLALRNSGLPPIPLKAVLTPTNVSWNAFQLHEELLREHRAMLLRHRL